MYTVAAKTVAVTVKKALDPDVLRLLNDDNDDLSRFVSDVEDLEEDFVVRANCIEGEDQEEVEQFSFISDKQKNVIQKGDDVSGEVSFANEFIHEHRLGGVEKPRAPRLLDEQFDLVSCLSFVNVLYFS